MTFRLDPQVFIAAAKAVADGHHNFVTNAVSYAARHACPASIDKKEFESAHIALVYWKYAPGGKRRMQCTRSVAKGSRRWFSVGCDMSAEAKAAHPWWDQKPNAVTPKIRADRVAALTNLAEVAAKFRLPEPDMNAKPKGPVTEGAAAGMSEAT